MIEKPRAKTFTKNPIIGTKFTIAISSAKGGVGKSTFASNLAFEQSYKSAYLVGLILIGLISYLLVSIFIKAFKISDINLKY